MLVSNHQNALMDAVAILFSIRKTVVFLARSDIFRNPKTAYWLYFLRVLPVYRMRDGYENLKNNDAVFETTLRVINYPRAVVLFPEGSHTKYKRLRMLQKGFARVAFQAIGKNGKDKCFPIIPIGIDYENFQKFGTDLIINYGQPVDASEYYEMYCENPALGLNSLRDRLYEEIKKLMIHIESERWYELTLKLIQINTWTRRNEGFKQSEIFEENRHMASTISLHPDDSVVMQNIEKECNQLYKLLNKHKLPISSLVSTKHIFKNIAILIGVIPAFILSIPAIVILGWIFILIRKWVNTKIKDTQFRTSVRYALYVLFSIILTVLLPLLLLFFLPAIYYPIGIISLLISTLLALRLLPFMKQKMNAIKSSFLCSVKNKDIKLALQIRLSLQDEINQKFGKQ